MAKVLRWIELDRLLPERRKRDAVVFLAGVAAALLLLAAEPLFLALAGAYNGFQERRSESRALAPLIAEAKALAIDYDDAVRRPELFKDKPVYWCVDKVSPGNSYLAGRPSQPLVWSNDSAVPWNSPTSGGRCAWALAMIEGSPAPNGLRLRYLGQP